MLVPQILTVPSHGTLKSPAQPGQHVPQPLLIPVVPCGTWPDSGLQSPPGSKNVQMVSYLEL